MRMGLIQSIEGLKQQKTKLRGEEGIQLKTATLQILPECWPGLQYQLLPELSSYTTLQISDLPATPTLYIPVCALLLFLWKTLTDTASIENMEGSDICPIFSLGYIPVSRIARTKFMSYLKKYEA